MSPWIANVQPNWCTRPPIPQHRSYLYYDPIAKPFNLKSYNKVWFSKDIAAPLHKFDSLWHPEFAFDIPIENCFFTIVVLSQEAPDHTGIPTEFLPINFIVTTEDPGVSISTCTDELFSSVISCPIPFDYNGILSKSTWSALCATPYHNNTQEMIITAFNSNAKTLMMQHAATLPVARGQFGTNTQ